jgi:CheY-like chemotaxis protein
MLKEIISDSDEDKQPNDHVAAGQNVPGQNVYGQNRDTASSAQRTSRSRTVLFIEDNPGDMKLVEQIIMRQPDIHLLTAVNGKIGMEMACSSRPDLILMDINLPDISGYKALKLLRSVPATANIPVIAISSNTLPMNIKSGIEEGFFRYLTKPIRVDEFLEAVEMALKIAQKGITTAK